MDDPTRKILAFLPARQTFTRLDGRTVVEESRPKGKESRPELRRRLRLNGEQDPFFLNHLDRLGDV